MDLWLNTAQNRPKGILIGMNETDIALDAQWPGDPTQFCKALIDVGFLEKGKDGMYSIHDWKEHQRYAYFSEERSKIARDAAQKRWEKRRGIKTKDKEKQEYNADIIQGAYKEHTKGNAPSPSPSPSPKNKDLSGKKTPDPRVKQFFDYWGETFQEETGKPYVFSFGKDGKLIKDLLNVHSLELLQDTTKAFFKDERCKQRGLTIGIFFQEINRLLSTRAMNPLEQARRELRFSQ